ncbi:unnamed protein product [Spirodela intermedia]|uniref:Uncharacterized protein n=1 Tax=Spirodela intermedia TaxID=51605 RepID=A0A7I8L1U9_SPIIN|nr:unnamed protein product [Spirodela intermedia]
MECICMGDQVKGDKIIQSSDHQATKEPPAETDSPGVDDIEQRIDTGNIEEAVSTLREGGLLNYDEARALLGRMEYSRGNVEAALRVLDGIDMITVVPKLKHSIAGRAEGHRHRLHGDLVKPMSMHAVSLLFEAILLKAQSLAHLGKFKEAAQSCSTILDVVQAAVPKGGFSVNSGTDSKLQEVLSRAVELLPELWKQAGFPQEAISSYRRALLNHWNIDAATAARIRKEFAVFLLYGGCEANPPPNSYAQTMDGSFVPRSNVEEAVLLLMIQSRMIALDQIEWDPSVIDHLTFAFSISGELTALAGLIEGLLPGVLDRKERFYTLALCYSSEGDELVALDLLKKILSPREDPDCLKALLLASKICGQSGAHAEDGVSYARRAVDSLDKAGDVLMGGVANLLMGISLSAQARSSASDAERVAKQREALGVLEKAEKMTRGEDPRVLHNLSLENAEQRKLDAALRYAKLLLRLEAGSNVGSWVLLARILSAQKRFRDAESVVNAALDQTESWSHGELLRIKARIQVARGQVKNAIETYTQLLALVHLRRKKNLGLGLKSSAKDGGKDSNLEIEAWHDLANVYVGMSQWDDAEVCLSKSRAIRPSSAPLWQVAGEVYKARGLLREALGAFKNALEIDPSHAPSMVSTAVVLGQLGGQRPTALRSYLSDALRLDRTNYAAWFNLGLLRAAEGGGRSVAEAAECFQAAALLEESAPVEDFR